MTRILLSTLIAVAVLASCSFDDGGGETVRAEQTTTAEVTDGGQAPEQPGLAADPDDVDFLDVANVSAVRQGELLAVSLTTYEEWDESNLERLSILYDTNLDGQANYFGEFSLPAGAPSLMIFGENQSFEPVPVERPDDRTAQFVHPIDVLFPSDNRSELDLQIAVESTFEGKTDRAPDRGWLRVAVGP